MMTMRTSLLITILQSFLAIRASVALAANPSMELKYFDIRGKGELARIIFALADVEYTDTRFEITPGTFSSPSFDEAKASGDLVMNLARAPVLVTPGGQVFGQSASIERYLCRKLGFMGETDEEGACIDCVAEHCRDVSDAQMRKGFSMFAKDKTEDEKAQLRTEWFEKDMPSMLEKIEEVVKLTSDAEGYAVGKTNSYADVVIFKLLKDCMSSDTESVTKASKDCKTLTEIAERVSNDENVAKWVKERPESMF